MSQNLIEKYQKRVSFAESLYSEKHEGSKMDNYKKLLVAACLDNTAKFLGEAVDASMGTQRADMHDYKKFCLNLITCAIPNLVAPELVITQPMTSWSGNIAYVKYQAGLTKGETALGDVLNDPFQLGKVDKNYTSAAVVEACTTFTSGTTAVAFTPVIAGSIRLLDANGAQVDDADGAHPATADETGKITQTSFKSGKTATDVAKIAYLYDNEVVPQASKIPSIKAVMTNIPLQARARRIAIYYSQLAAFEAHNDYGLDMAAQLAEKAVGQLAYEIDTEIVEMLADAAFAQTENLTWSRTLPVGVSKRDHYEGFTEIVEKAKQVIYDRTKRFSANYMVCASDIIPVLSFIGGWKAANVSEMNGPYVAGTLNGIKVVVSPALAPGKFFFGLNGSDMASSAGVYAPYMPVVPTQLLQMPDGLTQQGFATLYDAKILNANLLVAGTMVD